VDLSLAVIPWRKLSHHNEMCNEYDDKTKKRGDWSVVPAARILRYFLEQRVMTMIYG